MFTIENRPDGVVVINDAYNANPESMRAALNGLAEIGRHRAGRTWAVLGQMAELGDIATDEHDALGRLAASQVSRVVAVGEPARAIAHGADLAGGDAQWVPDADAAITLLEKELQPGDVVLVKASRAVGLESVALELGR